VWNTPGMTRMFDGASSLQEKPAWYTRRRVSMI